MYISLYVLFPVLLVLVFTLIASLYKSRMDTLRWFRDWDALVLYYETENHELRNHLESTQQDVDKMKNSLSRHLSDRS